MGIQKCKKCKTQFSYMDLIKIFLFGKGELKCKNCGALHSQIGLGRMIFLILIIVIPISFQQLIVKLLGPGMAKISIVFLVYVFIVVALIPFIIKYELKTDY